MELPLNTNIGLIILAFFTSALSGITAAGGGMLLISAMALFLPVHIVIPIHAVTQLASNFSRAILSPATTAWHIGVPFMLGMLIGMPGAIGVYTIYAAKFSALPLGIFVLMMVWLPPHKIASVLKRKGPGAAKKISSRDKPEVCKSRYTGVGFGLLGFIQIFITLFVGSSAPLNLPFLLQQQLKRDQLVATSAMMMTGVSLAKIAIFVGAGFSFVTYTWLLIGLLCAVFGGSWCGTRVRQYIPEQKFVRLLKLVLTLLALRLVVLALV